MRLIALTGMTVLATLAHAAPTAPAALAPTAASQRWIDGNDVVVRTEAHSGASVVARLSPNASVTLLADESTVGYCKVRTVDGTTGYTACRFLVPAPVHRAHVPAPVVDADVEKAFWKQPNWSNLEQYAQALRERHPSLHQQGPFPRSEALEKMKARLAQGTQGPKPPALADWADLKRKAERVRMQRKSKVPAQHSAAGPVLDDAIYLAEALGLADELHTSGESGGQRRLAGLIGALEFAAVKPSLFRSEAQVAPPASTAEQASGRFGIPFRQQLTARPRPKELKEDDQSPGVYDMLSRTDALARPVQRVQLLRDGHLRSAPSTLRNTETLWRAAEGPMCQGWVPGFAFGAADAGPWRFFQGLADANKKLNTNPPGSLFAFYTTLALKAGPASVTEARMTLERTGTGFVKGTQLYYDLDADGVPDLAVWEGQGKGPGDIERRSTLTDDRWYRLALVNINGAWKVLGSDTFSYGCGC